VHQTAHRENPPPPHGLEVDRGVSMTLLGFGPTLARNVFTVNKRVEEDRIHV